MLWSALRLSCDAPSCPPSEGAMPAGHAVPAEPPGTGAVGAAGALRALSVWALQFTPRVALAPDAVLMEVQASTRLFGGKRALRDRVVQESHELGVGQVAWAPTSLAALALARAGIENGFKRPLADLLDALPLHTFDAVQPHALTLSHLGCRTLGDVRRLPRAGLSRRFDAHLLKALDQAHGLQPEVHEWVVLPEHFHERLELMHRIDLAPAMLQGARRLLLLLAGWLSARHCGTTAFTLQWAHDAMRSRQAGAGGEITIRTAEPTRDIEHLCRLLAEHLARVELLAPVGELALVADEVCPLAPPSGSLLPDAVRVAEPLHLVLERLAARLGPEQVLRPHLQADHRLEWMCQWQNAALALPPHAAALAAMPDGPQPTFVLPQPLKLLERAHRPCYQGDLTLLVGPQRVEGGWWDRDDAQGAMRHVMRDYWVAWSERAGLLWVFQTRLNQQTAWYLHGHFA
jgi:protein ImuB